LEETRCRYISGNATIEFIRKHQGGPLKRKTCGPTLGTREFAILDGEMLRLKEILEKQTVKE
jgi:hypothetical protein